MRTRRPSRFQRQAQSRAAASPAASPSASTITSRTSSGRSSALQSRCRQRSPGRMAGRLHGGEAGLDAFADHQHAAGRALCRRAPGGIRVRSVCSARATEVAKAHNSTTARPKHHLLRVDRSFAAAITGKEGAVDCQRRCIHAVRHQRHHRRPDIARRVLQTGMEAQRVGQRQLDAARGEIGLHQRCFGRRACAPDRQRHLAALAGIGVGVFFVGDVIFALVSPQKAAFAQDGNENVALIAAGMAMHQHLAVFARRRLKGLAFWSSWRGHRAVQPLPVRCPPRALAMVSAAVIFTAASGLSSSHVCLASPQLLPNFTSTFIGTSSCTASQPSRAISSPCSRDVTEQSRQSCICSSGTMPSRPQARIQSLGVARGVALNLRVEGGVGAVTL